MELWATMRGIFFAKEMPTVPALPYIVFTSIVSVSRHFNS
jgi:hypothetical protein